MTLVYLTLARSSVMKPVEIGLNLDYVVFVDPATRTLSIAGGAGGDYIVWDQRSWCTFVVAIDRRDWHELGMSYGNTL